MVAATARIARLRAGGRISIRAGIAPARLRRFAVRDREPDLGGAALGAAGEHHARAGRLRLQRGWQFRGSDSRPCRRAAAAIAPAEMVVALAQRVTRDSSEAAGYLGIGVRPMTPAIAAATGASGGGVIVTWVDPRGPAASQIRVTDVIEAVGGEALATVEHWNARLARLRAGQPVALAVWSRSGIRDIQITAVPQVSLPRSESLGLTLRAVRPGGVEVAASIAASAGSIRDFRPAT